MAEIGGCPARRLPVDEIPPILDERPASPERTEPGRFFINANKTLSRATPSHSAVDRARRVLGVVLN